MKVAVGSTNPVKVRAVEKAFLTFFQEVEVVPLNVSSGVSPHPKSLEETYRGALNRAKESYKLGNFDYSVGIEAGILKLNNHYLDVHVSVIYDGERESVGLSSAFEYPKFAIEEIFKGREGKEIAEEISGIKDIGKGVGFIGYLTKNKIVREKLCEESVLMALVPIINERLYYG